MRRISADLDIGDIHFRDRWQFELKSDFLPHPDRGQNVYTQEFYLFIPDALQVGPATYTREQFYRDQTNLIRLKTPVFTFDELMKSAASPLQKLERSLQKEACKEEQAIVKKESRLLGNIVRTTLRNGVNNLIDEFQGESTHWKENVGNFCEDIRSFRNQFHLLMARYKEEWNHWNVVLHFRYVDEYNSNSINTYLVVLLDQLRRVPNRRDPHTEQIVIDLIEKERRYREERDREPLPEEDANTLHNEYVLYRRGLLNKFMLKALLLSTNRFSFAKTFRNIIGAVSAGIAMLIYLLLFIWQGELFVINSAPFVVITVLLYIIKDRLKDAMNRISMKHAFKWFSDYTTEILSPDESEKLGQLRESFSFLTEKDLASDVNKMRHNEFHTVLESFKRPEQILYHKKSVTINDTESQIHGLNVIFRFNIHHFLLKASNPTHSYVTINSETNELISQPLPKVYHLNIIVKNTTTDEKGSALCELKKYRIVVDKNGIKRVEHLR